MSEITIYGKLVGNNKPLTDATQVEGIEDFPTRDAATEGSVLGLDQSKKLIWTKVPSGGDLSNLAKVAETGSYNDLIDKPNIPNIDEDGNINMDGKRIDNIGIEDVNSLPTTNLYEGRMVKFKNKTYTFYNGLWLALSDDLRGRANDTHEENFVYQPTAADLSIKDGFADIKKLKGNTIVWNQLNGSVKSYNNYGVTQIQNDDGTFTLDGTAPQILKIFNTSPAIYKPLPIGHKGLFNLKHISGNITGNLKFYYGNISLSTNKKTIQTDSSSYRYLFIEIPEGCVLNNATFSFQVHDLTLMFGEGNEPTIEEFEAIFPNDYYEYNEGELMSFDGKGLKSVGFNQWDEKWEKGGLNQKNGDLLNTTGIRSRDFNKCFNSTNYYVSANIQVDVYWYDIDKQFISLSKSTNNRVVTSPNTAFFFKLHIGFNTDIITYDNNICINLSHSGYLNGKYEPYEDYTLSFQDGNTISQLTGKLNGEGDSVVIFPDGLRSAGTVYDEIVYDEATGKHKAIKRIGSVDMGILPYGYSTNTSLFYTNSITSIPKIKTNGAVINVKYPQYIGQISEMLDKRINTSAYFYSNAVIIKDTNYTDADSFKASLQGQILCYELETPEVYELDFPINTNYEAYDFGTEEVLYNDDKEVNIPMKANIEYSFNAVDMIRNNFEEIRKKQEALVSGTNIKTINGESLLGEGNIVINGGGTDLSNYYTKQEIDERVVQKIPIQRETINNGDCYVQVDTKTYITCEGDVNIHLESIKDDGYTHFFEIVLLFGESSYTVMFPSEIKWIKNLVVESNTQYNIIIKDNIAMWVSINREE